jgi:hypothetical protein
MNGRDESPLPEVSDHDNVAVDCPANHSEVFAIRRPVKIENSSRREVRDLSRRTASEWLLLDVRRAVANDGTRDRAAIGLGEEPTLLSNQ